MTDLGQKMKLTQARHTTGTVCTCTETIKQMNTNAVSPPIYTLAPSRCNRDRQNSTSYTHLPPAAAVVVVPCLAGTGGGATCSIGDEKVSVKSTLNMSMMLQ